MSALRESVPDARFPVVQLPGRDQLIAVRRGDVDVSLYRRTHEEDIAGLAVRPLREDLMIAAVREGHPALKSGRVSLGDLAAERFVSFRRSSMPLVYDRCLAACHEAGFTPDIQDHCDEPLVLALALVSGAGGLSGAGMAVRFPGVVYALVESEMSTTDISVVWHPENNNPLLADFVDRIEAHSGDQVGFWGRV